MANGWASSRAWAVSPLPVMSVALEAASVNVSVACFAYSYAACSPVQYATGYAWGARDHIFWPVPTHRKWIASHRDAMPCTAISRTHVTLSRIKASQAETSRRRVYEAERVADALRPLKCTLLESFVMLIKAALQQTRDHVCLGHILSCARN